MASVISTVSDNKYCSIAISKLQVSQLNTSNCIFMILCYYMRPTASLIILTCVQVELIHSGGIKVIPNGHPTQYLSNKILLSNLINQVDNSSKFEMVCCEPTNE
uniref:Uncharacterized protein n=1 Tax=Trichobilharzia regenti TaxID=157069 RepID=A0AA85JLJ1_TRIRE|nr:unnamed protein product [Trichobilharzia regenti]